MRTATTAFVLILAAVAPVLAQPARQPPPDLVLTGGKVFTADSLRPWAEAVAIRGERIVAVGTTAEIRRLAGRGTRRVELGGRVVVPGFNDAHAHIGAPRPGVGFRTRDDPAPDPPLALLLDSLAAAAARVPEGTWLRTTIDATVLDDPRARRDALDAAAPRHPVWLGANTGHGHVLNTAALRALGIGDDPVDPVGGHYEREGARFPGRGRGRVTGLLHEYAGWNAARALSATQPESVLVAAVARFGREAAALGITSVQDITIAHPPAAVLRAYRQARPPVRVRVVPMAGTAPTGRLTAEWREAAAAAAEVGAAERITVSGVKWILDGTGIERLAALREPYSDRPGWAGELNFPPDTLRAILREALAAGAQPVLHAIGDAAIAEVLAALTATAPDTVWRRLRPRLEHAEWLTPDMHRDALRLGAVVVENPIHFTDPPELVLARFGEHRAPGYQPFRSLVEAGIPLAIGSDGPIDPFLNLLFAVTHPANPAEALTMEQAVAAYTRGSAFAEHAEHEKGTLAPGMLADLAVLSHDIFTLDPEHLPGTTSVLTIVGGRVVHDALPARGRGR